VLRQRPQAGALQTLREVEGAMGVAAAHGLRRLAAAVCRARVEPGLLTRCYHHGLRPGRWVLELQEGRCARGNGGPAGGSLREHRWRRDDRSTQRRKQALGSGAVDASCWEDPCPFHESGQFWAPAREEAVLGSEPAGATSAGACCSGTAAPPKVQSQGSQKYAPQGATRWKKPLDPWDSGA